jgi:hypothetical protein
VSRCADLSRSAQGYFTQMTIMLFGQDQRESSELMKHIESVLVLRLSKGNRNLLL